MKNFLKIFLIFFLLTNFIDQNKIFAYPQDKVKQENGTTYIYPNSHAYVGIIIGGTLTVIGTGILIYDYLKYKKQKNNNRYSRSYFSWIKEKATTGIAGIITSLAGLITCGGSFISHKNSKYPFIWLDNNEIRYNGKTMKWQDLGDIDTKTKFRTYRTTETQSIPTPRGIIHSIHIPKTQTIARDYIIFFRKTNHHPLTSFSCENNHFGIHPADNPNNIAIPIDKLPISKEEFMNLVKNFKPRRDGPFNFIPRL
ncbi:hypothetical protein ACFLYH_00340 [Candidatus Dependentiae bacterium]